MLRAPRVRSVGDSAREATDRPVCWLLLGTMSRIASILSVFMLALGLAAGGLHAAASVPPPPAVEELYAARGGVPLWTGGDAAAAARRGVMLALLAAEERLDPAGADTAALAAAFAKLAPADQRAAEQGLTLASLGYLARRNGGAPVPAERALRALRRLDGVDAAAPLALALTQPQIVRALGGWHEVDTVPGPPPTATPLALVSPEIDVAPAFPRRKRLPEIGSLRRRLVQSLDLSATYREGESMDIHLAEAVRGFQRRHGLTADGVVGVRTLAALNARVADNTAQVRINLARRQDDRAHLPRYVEVNLPGYELRLVDHGKVVLRSRVIVGDEDSPTPVFDDLIRTVEVNPFWYVPRSIEQELVEQEQKKPGYLAAKGFYWRASATGLEPERLIQRPGPENALGRVKFLFPNHHAVYLHDTPKPALFGRSQRGLSHGCVRVEKWRELVAALLGAQGWDGPRLDRTLASGKTRRIDLDRPVPVFLDYRTAFVDDQGRLNLRADLYGHDRAGITVFPGKSLPPPAPPRELAAPTADAIPLSPRPRPNLGPEGPAAPLPAAFLENPSAPSPL
jgi:murein L,D-transpeptidase YcbB/YkuD